MCVDTDGSQKKALNPWVLELHVVMNTLTWVLGLELSSYGRAASALKCTLRHLSSPDKDI